MALSLIQITIILKKIMANKFDNKINSLYTKDIKKTLHAVL